MTDPQKITQLPELTTIAATDIFAIVDDPSGSPVTKKITTTNLLKAVDVMAALTAPAATDTLLILDSGIPKYITTTNFLKTVDTMAALATPAAADTMLILDSGTPKYITMTNFFGKVPVNINIKTTDAPKLTLLDIAAIAWDVGLTSTTGHFIIGVEGGSEALRIVRSGTAIIEAQLHSPLKIKEAAAAVADTVAYGQIWVKDVSPCELWFTDDAGADTKLA